MNRFLLSFLGLALLFVLMTTHSSIAQATDQKETKKKVQSRGWLGVSIEDVTERIADKEKLKSEEGAYVRDVVDDSPADSAGLQERDVIVGFAGKAIEDADDLTKAVAKSAPGSKVTVAVMRNGEKKTFTVVVGKMKSPRSFDYSHSLPPRVFNIPGNPHIRIAIGGKRIGLRLMALNEQLAEYFGIPDNEGVLVEEVQKGGAGEKAGFRAGDVIVRAGKRSVDEPDDVSRELDRHDEGETVEFEVFRKGTKQILKIEVEGTADDDRWNFLPGSEENIFRMHEPDLKKLQLRLETLGRKMDSTII